VALLYWLDRIQTSEQVIVGEKAFLLSRLRQEGYPVFPGFVVSSTTFQAFLQELEDSQSLLADFPESSLHLDVDNPKALQSVARNSHQAILKALLPADWLTELVEAARQLESDALILRSSISLPAARLSHFSGLLPAQVCWNHPENIEFTLKTAWSELFSAKSLFYWQRRGIPLEKINLAILVQPLKDVIATGQIAISPDSWKIQATWGLGQSLLKGEVAPDLYKIHSQTGEIEEKQLGIKSCAYRLQSDPDRSNLLELQVLSLEKQESYCLDEGLVEHLFKLTQNLRSEHQTLTAIEWTLVANSSPLFYVLQGQDEIIKPQFQALISVLPASVAQGLGASPGRVTAPIKMIPKLSTVADWNIKGSILVTTEITPAWLPLLKQASGLILEQGGMTSHGAIIARELGIPAIVGVARVTEQFTSDETILLDGNTGKIYRGKDPQLPTMSHSIATHLTPELAGYPIATQLMVNISQPSSIEKTLSLPIDGVGLLRGEWMLSERLPLDSLETRLASSEQGQIIEALTDSIYPFVRAFHPKPVFYRSFDGLEPSVLGKRGSYNYLQNPLRFELELHALKHLQNQGYSNIKLILPFVRSVEEFRFCQQRILQVGLTQFPAFEVWIMAEVPSVLFLLTEYVQAGVQGIAIGSNDLTQLLLGADRSDPQLSQQYNACHPAMRMVFQRLIQQAKALGIPCSFCGQAAVEYPELIDSLVEWGITAISVEPESVPSAYQAIARSEHRLDLEIARKKRQLPNYQTGSE
jgi:pyruvate,water dikinase